jgi:hypothetical protein
MRSQLYPPLDESKWEFMRNAVENQTDRDKARNPIPCVHIFHFCTYKQVPRHDAEGQEDQGFWGEWTRGKAPFSVQEAIAHRTLFLLQGNGAHSLSSMALNHGALCSLLIKTKRLHQAAAITAKMKKTFSTVEHQDEVYW